ncbi:MAG: TonB-dependent receptor [Acidobacteriota bacterium]|nr:TonB-dependent receptor [Acidobacteriota bacterium]
MIKLKPTFLAFLLIATLALLSSGRTLAQTASTGQIAGTVRDQAGAVIPDVNIMVTESLTGIRRETKTDSAGSYTVPLLPPGAYTVEFSREGFRRVVRENVAVRITLTTTVDVTLEVAPLGAETVTVTEEAPLLQTDRPTTGRVIEERTIRQLPLPTRNFQQMLALSPGTLASVVRNTDVGRGDAIIQVNGQRQTQNNLQINGVDANSIALHSTFNLPVPATEAIQEFIVQTSLYDASQGRNSGGVIAAVTKSGTNEFHGNVYEFFRNRVLNANDFFLNASGQKRPILTRNQFGFTLGGPVVKDKTFFFGSYQGTRERNGTSLVNSVTSLILPTALSDNRSAEALAAVGNTLLPPGAPPLTAANINPVALALLNARFPDGRLVVPSPPRSAGLFTTLTQSGLSRFREDQFNANLDHRLTTNNTLSGKFFFNNDTTDAAITSFVARPANAVLGWGGPLQRNNRVFSLRDTHVFTSSLINEARFGYSRIFLEAIPREPLTSAQVGIDSPLRSLFPGLPQINVFGLFTLGPEGLFDAEVVQEHFTYGDTVTWVRGRHHIRAGFEGRHYPFLLRFRLWNRGFVQFLNFVDFLQGDMFISFIGTGDPEREPRIRDLGAFFQDDFKVNDRLTLNFGVRYELLGYATEARGRLIGFFPGNRRQGPPPNGFVLAGNAKNPIAGVPLVEETLIPQDENNWAPRFGFAWKLLRAYDRLAVRGGYGVYYVRTSGQIGGGIQLFNYPLFILPVGAGSRLLTTLGFPLATARVIALPFARPFVRVPLPSAFPVVPEIPSPLRDQFGNPIPISGVYLDQGFRTPYTHQFNLNVQWEAVRNLLLEVGYVGARGIKLTQLFNLNQPVFNPATGQFVTPLAGFSNNGNIAAGTHLIQTTGQSYYHSLQLSVTKRLSHGLSFLASYTLSKSIDTNSGPLAGDLAANPGDQQNHRLNRGLSDWDRTHRFVYSFVYDLPKFYGGASGLGQRLLNDWQIAGVAAIQSGLPFTVFATSGGGGTNLTRANFAAGFNGSAELSGPVIARLDRFFNTAAFVPPLGATFDPRAPFGNTGRNILRGPDQRNLDFSLIKFIPIRETTRLEFRTEFFNLTNTPSFANPDSNVVSAAFGRISSTSTGPRVIQFALKLNW